jgi:hypothetical protein
MLIVAISLLAFGCSQTFDVAREHDAYSYYWHENKYDEISFTDISLEEEKRNFDYEVIFDSCESGFCNLLYSSLRKCLIDSKLLKRRITNSENLDTNDINGYEEENNIIQFVLKEERNSTKENSIFYWHLGFKGLIPHWYSRDYLLTVNIFKNNKLVDKYFYHRKVKVTVGAATSLFSTGTAEDFYNEIIFDFIQDLKESDSITNGH